MSATYAFFLRMERAEKSGTRQALGSVPEETGFIPTYKPVTSIDPYVGTKNQ